MLPRSFTGTGIASTVWFSNFYKRIISISLVIPGSWCPSDWIMLLWLVQHGLFGEGNELLIIRRICEQVIYLLKSIRINIYFDRWRTREEKWILFSLRPCFMLLSTATNKIKLEIFLKPFTRQTWYTFAGFGLFSIFVMKMIMNCEGIGKKEKYSGAVVLSVGIISQQGSVKTWWNLVSIFYSFSNSEYYVQFCKSQISNYL